MKILLDHSPPFLLAHGGVQIQIEQTKNGLGQAGVEVEFVRWWDSAQRGDLIHFFKAPSIEYLDVAQRKGIPIVITETLSEPCNRTDFRLRLLGAGVRAVLAAPLGKGVKRQFKWSALRRADCVIVGLQAERKVLEMAYGVASDRIAVVPLGLSENFLKAGHGDRSADYLISVGTITQVKGAVPLARLALQSQTPILFVGKPYAEDDPYWAEFKSLIDGRIVRHQGHVEPELLIKLLQAARGSVVMSSFENWSLAAHEAAACGLPLLLRPQKWAQERFGNQATYFPGGDESSGQIATLKRFYEQAPTLSPPRIKLHAWKEVGEMIRGVYERILFGKKVAE